MYHVKTLASIHLHLVGVGEATYVGTTIGNKGFYCKVRGKTRNGVKCITKRQAEETKR